MKVRVVFSAQLYLIVLILLYDQYYTTISFEDEDINSYIIIIIGNYQSYQPINLTLH